MIPNSACNGVDFHCCKQFPQLLLQERVPVQGTAFVGPDRCFLSLPTPRTFVSHTERYTAIRGQELEVSGLSI
jgi:hypothetical protein